MSAPFSWDLVPAFLALAEELQFARAAQRLGISRQALSRRIARLEAQVGSPVVVRSTRRVDLTPAGIVLRDRAVPIVAAIDEMVDQVRRVGADRPLSVGISTDLIPPWTTETAAWVNGRGTPAVLHRRPAAEAIGLLRAGSLDLVLLVGELTAGLPSAVVGHEPSLVVFPAAHPAARQSAIRVGDLRDLPVAVSDTGEERYRRARVEQLQGDPGLPYVLAPLIGTIVPGLLDTARRRGAVAIVLARGLDQLDTSGLAALPMDPPFHFPVTLVAREDLPEEPFRGLADHLLSIPPADDD